MRRVAGFVLVLAPSFLLARVPGAFGRNSAGATGSFKRILSALALATAIVLAVGSPSDAYPRPGITERVSVGNGGIQGREQIPPWGAETSSQSSDITPDGRYVAFSSLHGNLVSNDTNLAKDIFVHDRKRRVTKRVSVSESGAQAMPGRSSCLDQPAVESIEPSISASGRYVAFTSTADNLVPGDTNLAPDIFVHDTVKESTVRVSVASSGEQAEAPGGPLPLSVCNLSSRPSISADGRSVSFSSGASNLGPGDKNGTEDVYVHDLRSRTTKLVSGALGAGGSGNDVSRDSSISGDGRFVAFTSQASDLVTDDTNGLDDVFVRDLEKGQTERVSVRSDGSEGRSEAPIFGGATTLNSKWGGRSISSNGRFVVFTSTYTNLVPSDTNNHSSNLMLSSSDVFVHDRLRDRTERVSVYPHGGESEVRSHGGSISADGRFVLFDSEEPFFAGDTDRSDLVADEDDLGGVSDKDVFRYDRLTGELRWVSLAHDEHEGQGDCGSPGGSLVSPTFDDPERRADSSSSAISADGRFATFLSCAENLVEGDTNDSYDTFVRDLGDPLAAAMTSGGDGVAMTRSGHPPRGGRVAGVLVGNDAARDLGLSERWAAADIIQARIAYRPSLDDLYLRMDVMSLRAHRAQVNPTSGKASMPGIVYGFRFSLGSGSYEVRANGISGRTARSSSFVLYRCTIGCLPLATLSGGLGTVGDAVVVAVPREMFPSGHLVISDVEAFTALTRAQVDGPILDKASL